METTMLTMILQLPNKNLKLKYWILNNQSNNNPLLRLKLLPSQSCAKKKLRHPLITTRLRHKQKKKL